MRYLSHYMRRELFLNTIISDDLVIQTDKRKLVQIILTVVDFIRIYKKKFSEEKELIKCKIKQKNAEQMELKFFHRDLEVPDEVMEVLSRPWAGSRINSNRWGAKEFYDIV